MNKRSGAIGLLALILLVAGCSSGGGNHATSTTTNVTTPTTAVSTTTVAPLKVVAKLGPCPSIVPSKPLNALNARVPELDTMLVPIAASNVQICSYAATGELVRGVLLKRTAAAQFERETNLLRPPPRLFNGNCGAVGMPYVVLFASNTQQVDVADVACGSLDATNGIFSALPTKKWLNELQEYTAAATGTVVGTVYEIAGVRAIRRQIPGTVIATNASGKHWRTTTTATRPFSFTLPTGTYRFTGTSPLINGGQSDCFVPTPVVVVGGKVTQVEVDCGLP